MNIKSNFEYRFNVEQGILDDQETEDDEHIFLIGLFTKGRKSVKSRDSHQFKSTFGNVNDC